MGSTKVTYSQSIRNFRKYSTIYSFYFYRKNFIRKENRLKCLVIGLTRLILVLVNELVRFEPVGSVDGKSKLCVLIGSKNNYSAYLKIKSLLPEHDTYGFHTHQSKNYTGRVNLLKCYISGLPCLYHAVYYAFVKNGYLSNVVLKKLDWFILSNGQQLDWSGFENKKYEKVLYFSEYSAYIKKILYDFKNRSIQLLYFPHSRVPKQHPMYWADTLISENMEHIGKISNKENFYYLPKITFNKNNEESYNNNERVDKGWACVELLYCTNTLDSIFQTIKNVKAIRAKSVPEITGIGIFILIRPHPAEGNMVFKKVVYKFILGCDLDSNSLSSSLNSCDMVYGGLSGVVLDALDRRKYVFTTHDVVKIAGYYSHKEMSSVKAFDVFADNMADERFLLELIEKRKHLADSYQDTDMAGEELALKSIMASIFYD